MTAYSFFRRLCLVVLFAFAPLFSERAAAQELEFTRLDYATVRVFAIQDIGIEPINGENGTTYQLAVPEAGHGSGVIISADGLVLTAAHVVKDARRIAVKVTGSDRALPATVLYLDADKDFAFLAIDGTYEHFIPFPNVSPRLAVRRPVNAIGYPLDADRATPQSSQGIVSGMTNDNLIQLSIAVNPGNSGGPLVNERDELIGVVVARGNVEAGVQGIAIAVPLDMMRPTYKSLVVRGGLLDSARTKLSSLPASERVAASVVARLVQVGSVGGVFDEVAKQLADGGTGALRSELEAALREGGEGDADVLTMAAAYLWNAAIWIKEKQHADAATELNSVRNLSQRAVRIDPDLPQRSPFVAFALANSQPWAAGQLSNIRGTHESDATVTDNRGIPQLRIVPALGANFLHSIFGAGVAFDLHLAESLHVHLEYLFGGNISETNHAVEAYVGYPVSTWKSTAPAAFVVGSQADFGRTTIFYETSQVETSYALLVEVGGLGMTTSVSTCDAACEAAGATNYKESGALAGQLSAGLRYVRGYTAKRSDNTNSADYLAAYVHVMALPFGLPDEPYGRAGGLEDYASDLDESTSPIGGEIGVSQGTGFGASNFALAYIPALSQFMFRATWGYAFHL